MKETTLQWLELAETDLVACKLLIEDPFLTNVVAFHAQQVCEKCFKAILEEHELQLHKTHNLTRLVGLIPNLPFDIDLTLLQLIDSVYTTSRYPGDLGLMPEGKPSIDLVKKLFNFADQVFKNTQIYLKH